MELLERQTQLKTLHDELEHVVHSGGRMVLLGGEAGSGKSALIRQFCEEVDPTTRVMIGSCDAISAPRPLGPLFDVSRQLGRSIRTSIRDAEPSELFLAVLEALSENTIPDILVFEDVHWADEATIDLIRYLGRRIARTSALFVVSYRDDEVTGQHPLRTVFGDLSTSGSIVRIKIELLSPDSVAILARGFDIDVAGLYARTDGNPFYVTEVLAAGGTGLPSTVRDAVIARASRLSADSRSVLNVAAAIGGRIEPWLLKHVSGSGTNAIDESIAVGILEWHESVVQFRHQLGQESIYEEIPPVQRTMLHASILTALRQNVATLSDFSRLAHHADAAGDGESILRFAPMAAQRASSMSSHREAAFQYARALRFADQLPENDLVDLLANSLPESRAIGDTRRCIDNARALIAIASNRGRTLEQANWLAWLAGEYIHDGRNAESAASIDEAIALLELHPPDLVHANVYKTKAQLCMLNRDYAEAIEWGSRAFQLAEQLDDPRIQAGALNAVGSSRLIGIDEVQGRTNLERGLTIARAAGLHADVASLLTNLGSGHGEIYRFDLAERYLVEGITFARDHDLDSWKWYTTAWLSLTRLYKGHWNDATDLATSVTGSSGADVIAVIMAQIALGRVRARRGDPEVWNALDEALQLAGPTRTLQRLAPTHEARAEAAWLTGHKETALAEARSVFDLAVQYKHPWHIGELGYWRWKCGDLSAPPPDAANPWSLQISGNWEQAAAVWADLGCPYESARALAESDQEPALREAFATFDRLGAKPALAMVTQRLREIGATSIPRGARATTRSNPANLTSREIEVMTLLGESLTNGEIAVRLFLSPKTVEHHVSSVLAKLGASSRHEAVRILSDRTNMGTT